VCEAVDILQPKVVVIHAFPFGAHAAKALAERHRDVQWLHVYHGSQNHILVAKEWVARQCELLDLAQSMENVWYGTPEKSADFSAVGLCRTFVWPNTYFKPEVQSVRKHGEPVRVLLTSRVDVVKAMPVAIMGAAILNRTVPLEVTIVTKSKDDRPARLARQYGLDVTVRQWMPHNQLPGLYGDSDIVLQPSLSESFNYVALEAMCQSTPVVGAPAIRYMPPQWQADPNDPQSIADVMENILSDYESCRQLAFDVASSVCKRQVDRQIALYDRVLGIERECEPDAKYQNTEKPLEEYD
jgi:glycosyltransferase involved in cell wall biosynthesis